MSLFCKKQRVEHPQQHRLNGLIYKFCVGVTFSLLCFLAVGSVSVKAETTDMSETNNKLGAIESAITELKDYMKRNQELVKDITDYIHGENGNYSLNSLIFDQTNETNSKLQEQNEVITSLQEQTVSGNNLLQDVKQRTGDTVTLLLDMNESNEGIASTLTTLSNTLNECSADLATLSDQAQADINNQQLLEGLNVSISELNENIDKINTFLGYMYAFCIFVVIALITVVIFRILWNTLIKNMFTGV